MTPGWIVAPGLEGSSFPSRPYISIMLISPSHDPAKRGSRLR